MDFHSLARKDLQSLCKKNKIPANLTNVAMADALTALPKVEVLGNAQQSPERTTNGDPRTACGTLTRRKLVKVENESSQILTRTRRTTRRAIAGNERNNVNLPETPAPNNKPRGAAAASTQRKIDSQLIECGEDEKLEVEEKGDMVETPAIRSSRKKAPVVSTRRQVETHKDEKSVQRVYGKRQSLRVLEKTMEKLSLKEERKVEAVKIEGLSDEIEAKVEPDESLENECENHEAVEDSKTNDDEVDQLPKNECEITHKVNEDNESEVDFDENQNINIAQFLGSESVTKVELPEDSIANDCGAKLETESCANSDKLSDAYIQVETSDKEIDMIHESIGEKEAEITEHPENTMNSDMKTEMEKESKGNNQNESNDSSPFAIEADEISDLTEDESNADGFNIDAIDAQIDSDRHEFEEEPESNQYELEDSSPFIMEAEITSIAGATGEISVPVNTATAKEPTEDESKTLEMNQQNTDKTDANDAQIDGECHEVGLDSDKTGSSVEHKSHPPVSDHDVVDKMTSEEESDEKIPITSLKEQSPCVSSPFAGNTIQGQFPRPTVEEKVIVVDDNSINKENIGNGKEDDNLFEMSLRQLTKALKEKLQIKNKNVSKVGSRQALQKLPGNVAEAERRSD